MWSRRRATRLGQSSKLVRVLRVTLPSDEHPDGRVCYGGFHRSRDVGPVRDVTLLWFLERYNWVWEGA